MIDKWDWRFMRIAALEIATWSKDPRKQVGCIAVSPDKRTWTAGYNGFPEDVPDVPEWLDDRELKNSLMVHAEHNAILNNPHTSMRSWTMYITSPPCQDCAEKIIAAGFYRVVYPTLNWRSNWIECHRRAEALMREAGIVIDYLDMEGIPL